MVSRKMQLHNVVVIGLTFFLKKKILPELDHQQDHMGLGSTAGTFIWCLQTHL